MRIVDDPDANGFHFEQPNDWIVSEYWIDFETFNVMCSDSARNRGKAFVIAKGKDILDSLAKLKSLRKLHERLIEEAAYFAIGSTG